MKELELSLESLMPKHIMEKITNNKIKFELPIGKNIFISI